jgi:hypothetical protein
MKRSFVVAGLLFCAVMAGSLVACDQVVSNVCGVTQVVTSPVQYVQNVRFVAAQPTFYPVTSYMPVQNVIQQYPAVQPVSTFQSYGQSSIITSRVVASDTVVVARRPVVVRGVDRKSKVVTKQKLK